MLPSAAGLLPLESELGLLGPCKARPEPNICRIILRRLGPVGVQAPLKAYLAPSGSPPAEIKTNKQLVINK